MVETEALTLTLDEVRGIARSHNAGNLSTRTIETLYARLHGWAAAWTLLLERVRAFFEMEATR
jgi:ATP/maltotriose-dependent transcriptional regulator MalT